MPKTPSWGLDQNEEKLFIDRYWGRVPQFTIFQPENYRCEVNKDYLRLMHLFIEGKLIEKNVSKDLWAELKKITLNIDCPCQLDKKNRAIIIAFLGGKPCHSIRWSLDCKENVCCDELLLCSKPASCNKQ